MKQQNWTEQGEIGKLFDEESQTIILIVQIAASQWQDNTLIWVVNRSGTL